MNFEANERNFHPLQDIFIYSEKQCLERFTIAPWWLDHSPMRCKDRCRAMTTPRYPKTTNMYGFLPRAELSNIADLLKDNSAFAGITTYGLLPHLPCLKDESVAFDIATVGTYFNKWPLPFYNWMYG